MYSSRDIPVQCNLKTTIRMPAQYTLHNGYFPQFYCMPIIFRLWRLSGSPGLSGPTLASSSSWLIWRIRSPRGSPGSAGRGIPHIIVLTVTSRISLSGPWHPMCNCVSLSGLWYPAYHCPVRGLWHPVYTRSL